MELFNKHLSHYILLFIIFTLGIFSLFVFSFDQVFQIGIVLVLAVSYASWGIIHHLIHKDLYLSIILEYISISILGFVMVLSLILRR